jgi:transcriptional regulator with XRE-family HTH domain
MEANDPKEAFESVDDRARRRLRQLRTSQGLTLQQVADRAHLDVSTLSRLESGKRRLALDHLPHLAAALGVTTDDLLGSAPVEDPRVRGEPLRRDHLTMWPLTRHAGPGGLQVFKILIDAERSTPPTEWRVHEGHDWLYVIEGRLRLLLGDADLVIEPGEAVEFSTWTPHWFGAVDGPVEILALLGPHGERLHLHDPEPST